MTDFKETHFMKKLIEKFAQISTFGFTLGLPKIFDEISGGDL